MSLEIDRKPDEAHYINRCQIAVLLFLAPILVIPTLASSNKFIIIHLVGLDLFKVHLIDVKLYE